jgi:hypothetical protein
MELKSFNRTQSVLTLKTIAFLSGVSNGICTESDSALISQLISSELPKTDISEMVLSPI